MKILSSTRKPIDKTKDGETVWSLEVVEVVLVQWNLVDNQYQQKPELLCTFTQNNYYACLLNAKPSNLVFLKTYNTEFDGILITFMKQNGRPLEIDKVNLALTLILINRTDAIFYRTNNKKICLKIWIFVICKKFF